MQYDAHITYTLEMLDDQIRKCERTRDNLRKSAREVLSHSAILTKAADDVSKLVDAMRTVRRMIEESIAVAE